MPPFRKKPVVIEAVQFVSDLAPLNQKVTENSGQNFAGRSIFVDERGPHLYIRTLEGTMRCDSGDWIITGVKGERYPCKPDIFAATYEPAGESPAPVPERKPSEVRKAVREALTKLAERYVGINLHGSDLEASMNEWIDREYPALPSDATTEPKENTR